MLRRERERGTALVLALIISVLLAGLTAALMENTTSLLRASQQQSSAVQGDQIAEAGIDHARRVLQVGAMDGWSDEVAAGIGLVNVPFAEGSYTVDLSGTADLNVVLVNCTATLPGIGGTPVQRSIQAAVLRSPIMSSGQFALLTGGKLSITGNPTVAGTLGSVHANGDIDVAGKPTISKDVTTSGKFTKATPTVGGTTQQGAAKQAIPKVDPTTQKAKAQYILQADGKVLVTATGKITVPPKAGFMGWVFKGGMIGWDYTTNGSGNDGIFYAETNMKVSGNPGDAGKPWVVTLISTGSVNVAGNPRMTPADTVDRYLILAGQDVELSGNTNEGDLKAFLEQPAMKIMENPPPMTVYSSYAGVIAAHEQLWLNGNPIFFGKVIVEDAPSTAKSLTSTVVISGNPTILYNGDINANNISAYDVPVRSWTKMLATEMNVVQNAGSLTLHSYDSSGKVVK